MSRPSASARGYDKAWRKLRLVVLSEEPFCRYCAEMGHTTPAEHVDHIIPRRKRPDLRLERRNLAALCAFCHNSVKAKEEARGGRIGVGADGFPLDEGHPWS